MEMWALQSVCFACEPSKESTLPIKGLMLLEDVFDGSPKFVEGWRGCGATMVGPTALIFLHFVPIRKYMTCTSETMLFVQKSLLLAYFLPKMMFY